MYVWEDAGAAEWSAVDRDLEVTAFTLLRDISEAMMVFSPYLAGAHCKEVA